MSMHLSEPFAGSLAELSIQRLGERTGVVNLGPDLRHVELPVIDEAVRGVMADDCQDFVFDLTDVRRYETFALVRLAREWDRLAASGCVIHVAARDPRVVADLERLCGVAAWELHRSTEQALRALLCAPLH